MEPKHPSEPVAADSSRSRLMFATMLCAPLLIGGVLLLGTRGYSSPTRIMQDSGIPGGRPIPSGRNEEEPLPRVIEFPSEGPTPEGKVSLKDVRFDPFAPSLFQYSFGRLSLRHSAKDELALIDSETKSILWCGPVAEARFVEETIAAVSTVYNESGDDTVSLWSDKDKFGTPDLQLRKASDGQASLLDKHGATLWSGMLGPSSKGSSIHGKANRVQIKSSGVEIDGVDDQFTVKRADNGVLLWSGRLPEKPVIFVRDNHHYAFRSPNRATGGSDTRHRVRFEEEAGTVTIADRDLKPLGMHPVVILRRYETSETIGSSHQFTHPVSYETPNATLTTQGTIFLTYKDNKGRIIRRVKLYKSERSTGRLG
ncbi:MAG: hypothetical protein H8F28_04670 [Fibrella sp.]|nr:hypothetical protein [Armatimonadota bacterium]